MKTAEKDSMKNPASSGLSDDQILLIQSLQVPLLLLDLEFKIRFVNDQFQTTTGKPKEEFLGKLIFDLHSTWDLPELRLILQEFLTSTKKEFRYSIPNPFEKKADPFFCMSASFLSQKEDRILLTLTEQPIQEASTRTGLKELFTQAPAAIAVVHGHQHTFTFSNSLYELLFNRSRKQLLGKTLREVFPEVEGQGVFDLFDQVYSTGDDFVAAEFPVAFRRKEEGELETAFFNFTAHPLRNENGEVTDIMIHAIEVTEQVLARKKLEESEKRYRELVYSSPSMIAVYKGEDMVIEIANDAMLEVWGKGQDVIGKSLFNVLPEIKEQGFKEMIQKVFTTGEPHKSHELPVKLFRNGELYQGYFNFSFSPRRDIHGKIIGIFHIANEVTPEAEVNRKIRESEAFYRQMADLMPDKITNNDPQGRPIYFNQAWRDFTGRSTEEMASAGWDENIHPEDLPGLLEKWKTCMETGEEYEMEYRIQNKDGQYFWQLTRGVPVKDETGKIKMWITTATDIQKLKEEEKRQEAFLKMVSHELKTPLTSLKGYVQLLQNLEKKNKDMLPPSLPLKPSLKRMDDQINRLTRLVSEILDLSRVEYDQLQLKKKDLDINTLVEETVQDIQFSNPRQKIEITHNFHCRIMADKDRLGQVLINFITNAIKYSPNNEAINVEVSKAQEGMMAISIRDKGIGINKKDLEKIFQRFFRTERAEEDTYSGFGIGLFLSKEIVERHGGKITVESSLGQGSVFTFYLPCE